MHVVWCYNMLVISWILSWTRICQWLNISHVFNDLTTWTLINGRVPSILIWSAARALVHLVLFVNIYCVTLIFNKKPACLYAKRLITDPVEQEVSTWEGTTIVLQYSKVWFVCIYVAFRDIWFCFQCVRCRIRDSNELIKTISTFQYYNNSSPISQSYCICCSSLLNYFIYFFKRMYAVVL
jgi:hypothetical protein